MSVSAGGVSRRRVLGDASVCLRRTSLMACSVLLSCIWLPLMSQELAPDDKESSSRRVRTTERKTLVLAEQQILQHEEAHRKCITQMRREPRPKPGRSHCSRTWDNIMCWPDVPAGVTATQPCPVYLGMFRKDAVASRQCLPDGTWFMHPVHNLTWTNYTQCTANISAVEYPEQDTWMKVESIQKHVGHIKMIYRIGYSLSIVTLSTAVFVMLYFKKLHCPRNTLHVNLFLSFILRAAMSFLRDLLMVSGLGFEKDVIRDVETDVVIFRDDVTHWECRLFMVVFNYAMANNHMWIFVEGLYLHTLIFTDVFSETSSVTYYIVFGWTSSILFVIPWAVVRATLENVICWNTHPTSSYFWIIKAPVVVTVLLNFFFFINTVRVLLTKLRASSSTGLPRQLHKKLAKSTLVLIPLFGVPYIVFLGLPDDQDPGMVDDRRYTAGLVKLYFEMTFSSFNGFIVAMLFCFLNGEVQYEMRRACRRYNALGSHSTAGGTARGNYQTRRGSRSMTGSTVLYFPRLTRLSAASIQSPFTRLGSSFNLDQVKFSGTSNGAGHRKNAAGNTGRRWDLMILRSVESRAEKNNSTSVFVQQMDVTGKNPSNDNDVLNS